MSEIKFKRDTAFRKTFFVPDSFAHPAKMDAQLLLWIVNRYSEVGEVILDPMAGSGTTMLACGLGRDVILVELEEKFCKMMRDNWEEVRMRPQLGSQMGNCQIIQGDARQLEGLVDKIVTSPPFKEQMLDTDWMDKNQPREHRGKHNPKEQNPNNIGNLPYGEIDKCIFSPPFGGAEASDDRKTFNPTHHSIGQGSLKTDHYERGNLANLPYGQIDKIVTSPPYEEAMGKKHHSPRADKLAQEKSNPTTYTEVDSIITSPPYEGTEPFADKEFMEREGKAHYTQDYLNPKTDNIGNLKSQSYLEAMLQVYQQCYKVLKLKGLMILVTKNFIRNKQVIRLDTDTIKLCEQAGFSYLERHYRKLPSQSFWRIIYSQKHPEVEQILNEDVLVFSRWEAKW